MLAIFVLGALAQLVAAPALQAEVVGSIPTGSTMKVFMGL